MVLSARERGRKSPRIARDQWRCIYIQAQVSIRDFKILGHILAPS